MRKKLLLVSAVLPMFLHATTIGELFDALKTHPTTKEDAVLIQQAQNAMDQAYAKLYPNIDLFASYDHYNTPTSLLPVPPNKLMPMVQNQNIAQPFSKDITRVGATLGMPLFVKSIFTYADKARKMQQSAKAKKRINILKHEALIVGANANLRYLDAMQKALGSKRASLLKTKSFIEIKVKSGRAPKSALFKINDALSQVGIAQTNIAIGRTKAIETIESLTGIAIKHPVQMHQTGKLNTEMITALEPLRKKIEADRLEVKAQKERLYPSLLLKGSYKKSYADAYNNDKSIDEEYSDIGVVFKMPIFDKSRYTGIDKARLTLQKERLSLKKEMLNLTAQANALKSTLPLLEKSIKLYQASVADKKRLLQIAKVSYQSQRLSTEDYLKYEDDLVTQEAKLYQTRAQKWQTLMQLAVIYTNNIEEIVK